MKQNVMVTRKTSESEMIVDIDFSKLDIDYRSKINTPYPFLNHMIEHIAYRAGITIKTKVALDKFVLSHIVFEDLGIAFGKAIRVYLKENSSYGVMGFGDGVGIIDEAFCNCAMSFEDRAYFDFSNNIKINEMVEGIPTDDLFVFLEGIAQGASATIHINLLKGVNGHHIFEAIFRAFGVCLKNVIKLDDTRANLTSGVAGKIEYEIIVK